MAFTNQSKNTTSFQNLLKHGTASLDSLKNLTFTDEPFNDGRQLKDLTFNDFTDPVFTNQTKSASPTFTNPTRN